MIKLRRMVKARYFAIVLILVLCGISFGKTKNIILMIADGGGMNQNAAASYYEYGEIGYQVYDRAVGTHQWIRLGCATYSEGGSYSPESQWGEFKSHLSGYTDSSAAATALNSGVRIPNGQLNMTSDKKPTATFAQLASATGRSVGIVSSVPYDHATPAGVWSHNISRNNGKEIAKEMLYNSPNLDVVIGCGHPWYDSDGKPRDSYNSSGMFTDEKDWSKLTTGRIENWFFADQKEVIGAIASGAVRVARLFAVPRVSETLQLRRHGRGMGGLIKDVPSLSTLSLAALETLKKNDNGYYLMIEGGAIDWACHDNNLERTIEEYVDFNHAVRDVVSWIEANSSFDETLLIITADHETGGLWGDKGKFEPIVTKGKGQLPKAVYNTGGHSNQLVPLFAIGAGSGRFLELVDGCDSKAAELYTPLIGWHGNYVENVDVYTVMKASIH